MASGAFLDTSGWLAALSPKEAKHKPALAAYRGWLERGTPLVTTNLVVAEMQILLSRFRGAGAGLQFLDALYADATHRVIHVDRELERTAVDRWLRKYQDQAISLADATSFEVMRSEKLTQALALDRHFTLVPGCELAPR